MAQEENAGIAENMAGVDGKGHDNPRHPAKICHDRRLRATEDQLLDILDDEPKNFTAIVVAKLKQLRGKK